MGADRHRSIKAIATSFNKSVYMQICMDLHSMAILLMLLLVVDIYTILWLGFCCDCVMSLIDEETLIDLHAIFAYWMNDGNFMWCVEFGEKD